VGDNSGDEGFALPLQNTENFLVRQVHNSDGRNHFTLAPLRTAREPAFKTTVDLLIIATSV
jgi:hypothetical protein